MKDGGFDLESFLGDTNLDGLSELPSGPQADPKGVIHEESFGGWQETHDVIKPSNGYEKLNVSRGLVKFEVQTSELAAAFKWDAQLPEVLRKINLEDLVKAEDRILKGLFPFMFLEMPKMLGVGKLTDADTTTEFARISKVDIKFAGDKVAAEYRMANIDDRIRFALGFATRPSSVQSMKIYGGPSSSNADYMLDVDYPDRLNPARMTLSLPVTKKGVSSATSQIAGWMLGTHVRSGELGDLETPSTYLAVTMHDIVARAFDRKGRLR